MTSLLGTALSKQTGMSAQAAQMPGDTGSVAASSKIAIPTNPFGNLGAALGVTSKTPTTTTPIGGMESRTNPAPPPPGSAAAVVQNTTAAASAGDANNNQLQGVLLNGTLQSVQGNLQKANDAKAQAATDVQTYTAQQAQTANTLAGLANQGTIHTNYQDNPLGLATNTWSASSGGPPQLIVDQSLTINEGGMWVGYVYALQPDGSYQQIHFDGTKAANQQYTQLMNSIKQQNGGVRPTAAVANDANMASVVQAFAAYSGATANLSKAQAAGTQADADIANYTGQLKGAQGNLDTYNNTNTMHSNTAALGAQLANIGQGLGQAYQTDVDTAQQGQTTAMQQAGIGNNSTNAGAGLEAAAFGSADTAQANAASLNVQQGQISEQQGEQTATTLAAALQTASQQSGFQLQTMDQELTEAISALQNDLQYATGQQQQAIQAYINSLQQAQSSLQNSVGQSGLDQDHITQIATGIASGVSNAGAVFTASAKKAS